VAPYSVRRRPRAAVSTPLDWDELNPKLDPSWFNIKTVEHRIAGTEPWADFWKHRQSLPEFTAGMDEDGSDEPYTKTPGY